MRRRHGMKKQLPAVIMLACVLASCASSGSGGDAVTGATVRAETSSEARKSAVPAAASPEDSSEFSAMNHSGALPGECKQALIVVYSPGAESGTAKAVGEIAFVLDADVISPGEASEDVFARYELIGFASGIFDQKHHASILQAAERLPDAHGFPVAEIFPHKRFIIISTSGVSRAFALRHSIDDPHGVLRSLLEKKNGIVAGEFNCLGLNVNSILKYFGGMNRGRPNRNDLAAARAFALDLFGGEGCSQVPAVVE